MILSARPCKVKRKICKEIMYLTVSGKLSAKKVKKKNSPPQNILWVLDKSVPERKISIAIEKPICTKELL